jgi:hypothetical protein
MNLFDTIAKAWKGFASHKKLLPLIVLVDVLFLYSLTRLHYEVFNRASVYAIKLSAMMSEQVQAIGASEGLPELAVLSSPEFASAYHALLKYIGIFFAGSFLIWLVCKGFVWLLAHKTVEKRTPLVPFALKFAGMTLFWLVAFLALAIVVINLFDYTLFGVLPLIGRASANVLAVGMFWALAYFVFISYALVPKSAFKNTFVLGVKCWKELLPVHAIGSLVFFIATTTPISLVKVNMWLSLAFIVFVALPMIAWSRVLWITAVQRVMRYA